MNQKIARIGLSCLAIALCTSQAAMADTRAGATVFAGGKVATNPFNAPAGAPGGTSAASVSAGISPWVKIRGERTTVTGSGNVRVDQYLTKYGRDTAVLAALDLTHQASENTQLVVGAAVSSSRAASYDQLLYRQPLEVDPTVIGLPLLPDVGLEGATRSSQYRGYARMQTRLSDRDILSVDVSATAARYNGFTGSNFNTYTGGVSYSRRLNQRTSITLGTGLTKYDYLNTANGDGTIIAPRAGISHQLSERWKLNAGAGASIVRSKVLGVDRSSTAFAADLSLCNSRERSTFCLGAARAAQPTSLGVVSTVTSITAGYDLTTSKRDRVSISGRYSDTGGTGGPVAAPAKYIGAAATYNRTVNQRLGVFVSPSFTKMFDTPVPRKTNVQITAGLSLRLGATE